MVKTGIISDKRLSDLLKNLVKYGHLAKKGDRYIVPDPVVRHACNMLKP